MRHYINITILAMLFGLFGCKNNKKKDFIFDEFKSQIEKQGMKIDSVDETGLIYISQGEVTVKISLDKLSDLEQTIEMNFKEGFTLGLQQLDELLLKLKNK